MSDSPLAISIDPEFRRMVYPLPILEYRRLENDIIQNGCIVPLSVWNGLLIDGHTRYEICQKQHIPYKIKEVRFPSRNDALLWLIVNQLNRNNISEEIRRYLSGKKMILDLELGNFPDVENLSDSEMKHSRLYHHHPIMVYFSKQYHVSSSTAKKYVYYARAIDKIAIHLPEEARELAYGNIKISIADFLVLSKEPISSIKYKLDLLRKEQLVHQYKDKVETKYSATSIKDMPQYDPDAYVMSLAFTIPTWIQTIQKTKNSTDMNSISPKARIKLHHLLDELISSSAEIMKELEVK